MKHTEGTWITKDGQIYPQETGKTLALIPYFDKDDKEQEANARLIAAAPDMLKVCTDLLDAFVHKENDKKGNQTRTDIFKYCPEFGEIAVAARYAIRKATIE